MTKRKQGFHNDKLKDTIVKAIKDKKGQQIKLIDLKTVRNMACDYFVISHGESSRQIQTIAENIEEQVWKNQGERPFNKEGKEQSDWILIDYVDIVVHLFKKETREFYSIEDLWGDANILEIA